jgi:hypothetical protein
MVVTWAIDQKGYSQRRACALIGIAPKTYDGTESVPEGLEDVSVNADKSVFVDCDVLP